MAVELGKIQQSVQQVLERAGERDNSEHLADEPFRHYHYIPLGILDEKELEKIGGAIFLIYTSDEAGGTLNQEWTEINTNINERTLDHKQETPCKFAIIRKDTPAVRMDSEGNLTYMKLLFPVEIEVSNQSNTITRSNELQDGSILLVPTLRVLSIKP